MKFFIALSAVILAAAALPTEIGKDAGKVDAATFNSTARNAGMAGFATVSGGTFGGAGGAVWTVWDAWALRDAVSGDSPRIVYVRGFIDLTPLFTGSPGIILVVGKFKSIIGGDSGATIYGGGFKTYESWQVIFQRIKFQNIISYAPGEQPDGNGGIISMVPGAWSQVDAIDIEDTLHVWIDHCEFTDDPWHAASLPDNMRRHDGNVDIKRKSNWISVSNCLFTNHNLVSLVGHSDSNGWEDIGHLKVTFYLNWFQGTVQRNPMVRYGEVHLLNNLYTDIRDYGIGVWTGALIYAERNVFHNTRHSWAFSDTVPNPMGYLMNVENLLVNSAFDGGIPSSAVGWRPSNYYGYNAMAASNVEWHVKTYAGTCGAGDGLEGRTEEAQFPKASALRQSPLMKHCPTKGGPKCPPASKRYRTHDGTCNNLNRPRWGSTLTPVQRFLPPSYSDGLQAPRRSITGSTLPSAREISALVHQGQNVETPGVTHLLMQWGQFLDHDVTQSSQSRGFNGSVPRCCKNGGRDFVPKELLHPECFPIPVPPSDPFYGPRGVRCLDFVRSSPAPRDDCALGWREQLNQVSAYIDGSPLYASSARQSDRLRLFRNGMLQYGRVQQRRPILPPERRDELCRGGAVSADCFKSGDARVNEHPGLIAAHIVWMRQHNRMAQELAHLNPHWSDEKIYQETRKIVGAMIQHITYREFLPIVLGSEVMKTFELDLQKKGYYKRYNPKINPSPASAFGSAAFRFGHSLVQPSMVRFDRFHRPMSNNVSLHMELTNPSNIWSMGAVDRLLLGMLNQPIQKRDEFITEELTNHLFQTPSFDFGMDLAAINIQRGRDHGVPSYTTWREPCGLSVITDFEDLFKMMPSRVVWKLKVLYRNVDDIDLFTGGMAERPVVGGLVGPTFACIIAQQFLSLRKGDRFWYENGGFESSFTPAQLQQIRRISFAQVLCRTLDTITNIQPFAFLSPDDEENARISCKNGLLNNFDLSPWIEIDSEFDNDVKKSDDDPTTQKPKRTKPTTLKPTTTTKKINSANKVHSKRPQLDNGTKTSNVTKQNLTENLTDSTATDDSFELSIEALTRDDDKHNITVEIDDKLDFKNKSKRVDDGPNIDSRNSRPKKPYGDYDYEDDDTQSVQSVIVNNLPHKRPYNNNYNNRPSVLTVTENTNKYTYLINYVPRPTESYRQTTRRTHDRDVVKVTYQTYDDTYRRPNKPYYNRHELNNNYRDNRPNTRTTMNDKNLESSARSNDESERTTAKHNPTDSINQKPDHKTDTPTTENLYKLITFGYVGSYRGDMTDDKFNIKTDVKETKKEIIADKQTDKGDTKQDKDSISKDFSTYAKSELETEDVTNKAKLSTFYLYDTATKPYNFQRSTRRNDDDEIDINASYQYYYVNNVLHKRPKPDSIVTDKPLEDTTKDKETKDPIPKVDVENRASLDSMPDIGKVEAKATGTDRLRVKKKPSNSAKTPTVAFQIIPSEVSPSQWAVYDEDADLPEGLPHRTPAIKTDPHALREIPRPMSLMGLRRRPGPF